MAGALVQPLATVFFSTAPAQAESCLSDPLASVGRGGLESKGGSKKCIR